MSGGKDSAEVVKFMTLFQKLRDKIDDDPEGLAGLSATDESVKKMCNDLHGATFALTMKERHSRNVFAAPIDPSFIEAWRDYESRFESHLVSIFLMDLGLMDLGALAPDDLLAEKRSQFDIIWDNADDEGKEQLGGIEAALDFAEDQATQDGRGFPEGFPESIEDGIFAWSRLKTATRFDLQGIFRRRELIPFVLVPRHVAAHHGSEKLSLYTHLKQVHDAFVFGVPFAAVALMRSIMETVLCDHYGAEGKNLKQRIDNCPSLPRGASQPALHRLRKFANAILHFDNESIRLPEKLESRETEKEMVSLLLVLRELIEGAPK